MYSLRIGWSLIVTTFVATPACWGGSYVQRSIPEKVYRSLQSLELRPLPQKPDWADVSEPPCFSFAWIADLHLDGSRLKLARQAFDYIDRVLKPAFVVFTGDNNAYAPGLEHKGSVPSATMRRHLFFKWFLRDNLRTPYIVIPGDDWPEDFEKVWGPFQFSFDYGGMHFLLTALDRCTYGVEGRAVFEESTWNWMEDDLARNTNRPTLFLMHETVVPPSFLDAERARRMLESHTNVIAAMCGHMHLDLEFRVGRLQYLIGPGMGPNPRHGLKHVMVYRHAIILRTIEYNGTSARYEPVMKWQKIDIPLELSKALHEPASSPFRRGNYRSIPAHPRRSDPSLMSRTFDLVGPLMRFMGDALTGNNQWAPASRPR
jgi:hypothetical protein